MLYNCYITCYIKLICQLYNGYIMLYNSSMTFITVICYMKVCNCYITVTYI